MDDEWIPALAINGNNVFAGSDLNDHGVYLSTNNGTSWTQTFLNNRDVRSLAVNGNNVFAGTNYGIYVSTNNGTSFTQRNEGISGNQNVLALCIFNNYIFAGTGNNIIYRRPLSELIIKIQSISQQIPAHFTLEQNFPNPFNPTTTIIFDIQKTSDTKLIVYDALGREIATLVNEELKAGSYQVDWNATGYSSGMYFYKLITDDYVDVKKMIFMK